MAGLYMGQSGPIIPAQNLDAMLINAAKKSKEGVTAKSAVFTKGHAEMIYDGPSDANQLWENESFRFAKLVKVGTARIMRMRPIFNNWQAVVEINFEPAMVNESRLMEWWNVAGSVVGLGDWRPQYGRFEVKRLG